MKIGYPAGRFCTKGRTHISPFAFGTSVLGLLATLFQRYRSRVVQAAVNEPVRHTYSRYVHAQSKRRSSSPRMFRRPSATISTKTLSPVTR